MEAAENNRYWLDDMLVQCVESSGYAYKDDFPLDFLVEIRRKIGALDEVDAQEKVQKELSTVAERYWSGEPVILDVPHLCQNGTLPNGCEAVSAAMLLQYYGFSITAEDFVDQYLECEPVEIRWGCRYGPNPREVYAGDPRSEKKGWGCFAPVIQKALTEAAGEEYTVQNLTGMPLPSLTLYALIMQTPVVVWTTVDMKEVDKICQWQSADGEESFLYPANQHCMVLIGMDMENYYFQDPKMESGIASYPREQAEAAYNSMGKQAIALCPAAGQE